MNARHRLLVPAGALAALLSACGGGGGGGGENAGPTLAQRSTAAKASAESTTNACAAVRPFYWEVGDAAAAQASGSVDAAGGAVHWTADSVMPIASASKWLYGAYVAQRRGGALTADDVRFLSFRSGYIDFTACERDATVQSCAEAGDNNRYTASADGRFSYGGGHMQQHAARNGLGAYDNAGLAAEMRRLLDPGMALGYSQPQLAGGAATSAAQYARVLRGILGGRLVMHDLLGSNATCTNPATCPTAINTPVDPALSWSYSIGHWVENDPASGDGAFSSAGAFGFYPWIDASRRWYGVLARSDLAAGAGGASAECGALIRRAWMDGVAR
ncbi:hypothetical protein [Piscinibacter sp.]|uniref:hypothetical protein n=1 Tax=Piscinibacter sp. TaxID=1903157 RepID=UPI0039E23049